MDTRYVDAELIASAEISKEEAELLNYLDELASGKRWIYTESARIVAAVKQAAMLLHQKNQIIALLCAERKRWEEMTEEKIAMGYKIGRQAKAKEMLREAQRLQAIGGCANE